HDALDGGGAEVVRAGLHDEPVDADGGGAALVDVGGDEVHPGGVGVHDGGDQGLGDVAVVGQQLAGVLGQAVAAVAEGGVVVVVADAGVQPDALDDLAGVQAAGGGVGVQLVEVG